jgi:para-aminobenzoate synthetase component 1
LDRDGRVEARPIKGTRPRGANPAEDAALAAELLASDKDRAENLMIVDLMRNDLSRVCALGSVCVPELFTVEHFARVHHLVSAVEGRLRDGLGPRQLLEATFPPGSITGAPKVRAMEIIAELEPERRGPVFGAMGWIGWDGAMDMNVAIRTMTVSNGSVSVRAGGGIVAESDALAEYAETVLKAGAMLTSLEGKS